MTNMFQNTITPPDISLKPDHIVPTFIEPSNAFSSFMAVETSHSMSYTIPTANPHLHKTEIRL